MQKPVIIVGAGISGATIARQFADTGQQVIVVDKRDHIGGNVYDYTNEYGVMVGKYGAHIYHDSDDETWNFLSRFTEWIPYEHRVKSLVDEKLVSVPVTIDTFNVLSGETFRNTQELQEWIALQHPEIQDPQNSKESALKRLGSDRIYEKMFKNYTKKQWDKYPEELEASALDRIPVRYDSNDRYFSDTYEAIPKHGYTHMVSAMLNHPNIQVILGSEYDPAKPEKPKMLFYTGKIDSYFNEELGKLEYRSLEFEHETFRQQSYQEAAVINYPDLAVPFTRIVEYKKIYNQETPYTTIVREYSRGNGEPYYPVPTQRNRDLYALYQEKAIKLEQEGIYFVGRLASYKYYNMNQAVRAALDLYNRVADQPHR